MNQHHQQTINHQPSSTHPAVTPGAPKNGRLLRRSAQHGTVEVAIFQAQRAKCAGAVHAGLGKHGGWMGGDQLLWMMVKMVDDGCRGIVMADDG